jgi:hypothetical protein
MIRCRAGVTLRSSSEDVGRMRPLRRFRGGHPFGSRIAASALTTIVSVGDARSNDGLLTETRSRQEWFQNLFQPGTDAPCCDVADCKRTIAEWRAGGWWAVVRGEWRSIPRASILKVPRSIDGDAYVCSSESTPSVGQLETTIYCFVPPDLAY